MEDLEQFIEITTQIQYLVWITGASVIFSFLTFCLLAGAVCCVKEPGEEKLWWEEQDPACFSSRFALDNYLEEKQRKKAAKLSGSEVYTLL